MESDHTVGLIVSLTHLLLFPRSQSSSSGSIRWNNTRMYIRVFAQRRREHDPGHRIPSTKHLRPGPRNTRHRNTRFVDSFHTRSEDIESTEHCSAKTRQLLSGAQPRFCSRMSVELSVIPSRYHIEANEAMPPPPSEPLTQPCRLSCQLNLKFNYSTRLAVRLWERPIHRKHNSWVEI